MARFTNSPTGQTTLTSYGGLGSATTAIGGWICSLSVPTNAIKAQIQNAGPDE